MRYLKTFKKINESVSGGKKFSEFILPRFETFDNFIQTDVGIDYDKIRLTFEIVERE